MAVYKAFSPRATIQLQMLTEEMLSMARSITGELNASFWIECEGSTASLHMATKTVMDRQKRDLLIASATSRSNEKATTFLGKVSDFFENAMLSDPERNEPDMDLLNDLPHGIFGDPEWDGYERSILRKLADDIKIGIDGGQVEMTVSKRFEE